MKNLFVVFSLITIFHLFSCRNSNQNQSVTQIDSDTAVLIASHTPNLNVSPKEIKSKEEEVLKMNLNEKEAQTKIRKKKNPIGEKTIQKNSKNTIIQKNKEIVENIHTEKPIIEKTESATNYI